MLRRDTACALAAAIALAVGCANGALAQSGYQLPPKPIADILDARPLPTASVSPSRQDVALLERASMPTIAELSQPMLRLAGARINPRTNGPHRPRTSGAPRYLSLTGITLLHLPDGKKAHIAAPPGSRLSWIGFSPDGRRLAFTETKATGIALWVADASTGAARALTTATLNAAAGPPCDWVESATLLCQFIPAMRGPAPKVPLVPEGPNIQENLGKAAPVSTYEDLLRTAHDETLFEHYFTSQLALVDAGTGARTLVGKPAIFDEATPSPDGEYVLVSRLKKPYSHLVPFAEFPKDVEIWNRAGKVVRAIADLAAEETVPMLGVPTGPRAWRWNPVEPATAVWAEALDGGDLRNKAAHRDKVVSLKGPFAGEPAELIRLQDRFQNIGWTEKGLALVSEFERSKRMRRVWLLDGGAARKAWEVSAEDRYRDPGTPLPSPRVRGAYLQSADAIYLTGAGASDKGERPFLDRVSVKTLDTERLFQCEAETYETVTAVLSDDGRRLLTQFETPADPPNYFLRDLGKQTRTAVTTFTDPAPQLSGVRRQFITYERKDGVKLNATLYLPPGYKDGERLPVVLWAYPTEFTDPRLAGQVSGSPYRFSTYAGATHLFFLTQGYAVLDDPKMPIIGSGETANDTYVDQLVASAQAAVDKVVAMGVADRDRIGVGGHSYGAFMTANLLAHSRIFRAGIARSGAYNRTLTPFGFQSERRTFWEVPEVYGKMSPFYHANDIKDPILLIHGEADDNSGTFPIQSERLYMALKGHGATVRYVTLPNEAHGYMARESVLHTLAEMVSWFDRYVKNAPPRVVD
jgi:dipeptidyl aminopeptidase/acylaminoacyl peptidase